MDLTERLSHSQQIVPFSAKLGTAPEIEIQIPLPLDPMLIMLSYLRPGHLRFVSSVSKFWHNSAIKLLESKNYLESYIFARCTNSKPSIKNSREDPPKEPTTRQAESFNVPIKNFLSMISRLTEKEINELKFLFEDDVYFLILEQIKLKYFKMSKSANYLSCKETLLWRVGEELITRGDIERAQAIANKISKHSLSLHIVIKIIAKLIKDGKLEEAIKLAKNINNANVSSEKLVSALRLMDKGEFVQATKCANDISSNISSVLFASLFNRELRAAVFKTSISRAIENNQFDIATECAININSSLEECIRAFNQIADSANAIKDYNAGCNAFRMIIEKLKEMGLPATEKLKEIGLPARNIEALADATILDQNIKSHLFSEYNGFFMSS